MKKFDTIKKQSKVHQVYVQDTDGNFKFIDMDKIKLSNGLTLLKFMEDVNGFYQDTTNNIQYLIDLMKDAQFVYPDKQYAIVGEKNGYICEGTKHIVELTVDEKELYKGYCKIYKEGNVLKVVIDEKQKQRYLKTFEGGNV